VAGPDPGLCSLCCQALPGAHKPQRPALPSNDAILQAVAGAAGDAGGILRPRTAALAGGRRVETRHVHGEIVDSAVVQELHTLTAKKEREVFFSASIPPSPSLLGGGDDSLAMSPASLQRRQQMLTPPTVKRGVYAKGGGSDCDPLSPRRGEACSGGGRGDETPSYAASPSPSPPSAGRYSSSTAAARARLIEEAKARQLFAASSPGADSASARHNVLTPHTRPTGPSKWPDVAQQKAAAAEKRQLYKEELDMQISAKKGQGVTPLKLVDVKHPALGTVVDARKPEDKLAVYENAQAIAPQVSG